MPTTENPVRSVWTVHRAGAEFRSDQGTCISNGRTVFRNGSIESILLCTEGSIRIGTPGSVASGADP